MPGTYLKVVEMETLLEAEDFLNATLESETTSFRDNQYASTANEAGIVAYETMLNIKPDPATESLSFRRARIVNRLSMAVPFSYRFLEERLNEIIGVGMWDMFLNYNTCTLTIESSAENQQWYHEILVTIDAVKPANIVFINKPKVPETILVGEQVNLRQGTYNYKLGTTWRLGTNAFRSLNPEEVIKLAGISSVKPQMLADLAGTTVTLVNAVLLNDTYTVTTFTTKTSVAGVVTIEYEVDQVTSGIDTITNIKLIDASSNVLTESAVYIPLVEQVVLKHTINVKEGT